MSLTKATSPRLVAPECIAARPALATTGDLTGTGERLAAGGKLSILAIGSSTTAGVGTSSPAAAYPARLEAEIERRLPNVDVKVTVSGVGGETAAQTIARLEREVAQTRPDLVIWQVGTNDALSDVREDDFRSLVERGIAATTAAGADLILLDQQFFPSLRRKARYERFVQIVRDAGMKKRACVFGRYALMKEWGEESSETLKTMLSGDGFHMSDRGHACMARILADEIVKASFSQIHASGAI
jgi:lysophospholipase L1-like esterase